MQKLTKITRLFTIAVVGIALCAAVVSPPLAQAALEAEPESLNFMAAGPTTLLTGTAATNTVGLNANKTLKIQPGHNVTIMFNMAGSGAATLTNAAFFQYRCGGSPWSTELLLASKALAGTANVCAGVQLTNGLHFPAAATELRYVYMTNSSGVTAYHTNLWGATWKTVR